MKWRLATLAIALTLGGASAAAAQQRGGSMADLLPAMPKLSTAPGQAVLPGESTGQRPVAAPRIPLQPGLVITTVSPRDGVDEESEKSFIAADEDSLTLAYRAVRAHGVVEARRILRRVDLAEATAYRHAFADDGAQRHDGTTAVGVSTRVLRQLRDGGSSAITLDVGGVSQGAGIEGADLAAELDGMLGGMGGFEGIEEAVNRQADQGTITEAERAQGAESVADVRRLGLATGRLRTTGRLRVPVIVNDRRVLLDAITAIGSLSNGRDDFAVSLVVLNDPANPLALRLEIDGRVTETTRIAYARSSAVYVSQIEQALLQACRVDVYGLGFAPGAAQLQPGSEETLAALRSVFDRHADWTLAVLSHGDDRVPASLSMQRAVAIQRELSNEDGARLVAVDLPRPAPLAGNHSVAGRALNRRTTFSRSRCTP